MPKEWEKYETAAIFLLRKFADELELKYVEGKQKIEGNISGTNWEIDGKGIKKEEGSFLIIECRRYINSKQSQEKIASLAYRIKDTGATGGILVSPLGMQEGAEKIANAENIIPIYMNQDSDHYNYTLKILNDIIVGSSEVLKITDSVIFETIPVKKKKKGPEGN